MVAEIIGLKRLPSIAQQWTASTRFNLTCLADEPRTSFSGVQPPLDALIANLLFFSKPLLHKVFSTAVREFSALLRE
jgi:hypothetical protein